MQACGSDKILWYSSNASAVFNAAVRDLASGTIFVRNGTYSITNAINLRSNLIVTGESWGAVLHMAGTSDLHIFNVTNVSNVTITNLHFDGNSQTATGSGASNCLIYVGNAAKYITIDHNYFSDAWNVAVAVTGEPSPEHIVTTNNLVTNAVGEGIHYSNVHYGLISHNEVAYGSDLGIALQTSRNSPFGIADVTVSDNFVHDISGTLPAWHLAESVHACYNLQSVSNLINSTDVTFIGNNGTNCPGYGFYNIKLSGYSVRLTVADNHFTNVGTGIYIEATDYAVVTGNTVSVSTAQGIYGDASTWHPTITSNVLTNIGSSGIEMSGFHGNIADNQFSHINGDAIWTNGQDYNIEGNDIAYINTEGIVTYSSNNTIESNEILGNPGYYMIDVEGANNRISLNTIIANRGYGVKVGAGPTWITNNDFTNDAVPITDNVVTTTTIIGNKNYNPLGAIRYPFVNGTTNIICDGVLCKGVAVKGITPANSTSLTVTESPKLIEVSIIASYGTSTLSIWIDSKEVITAITPPLGTTYSYYLQPGETFKITWHATTDTKFYVFGE